MALVSLIGAAACFGMIGFIAFGGGASKHASGWLLRRATRLLNAACAHVADSTLVAMLMRLSSWEALASEMARRARKHGALITRKSACALLLMVGMAAAVLLGLAARSPIGLIVGAMASIVAVPLWYSSHERKRERALIDEMPEIFRTLAMALGSGETLTQAIEYVGIHAHGYASQAFMQAALSLRCGASTEEAMEQLSQNLDAPGVGLLTTALVIAQRTGSPLRGLFQSSAKLVEQQGEYERMLSVKTAQVRLSVRIVCLMPLLLVGLLSLISRDFQQGLSTLPGIVSIVMAAAMDGCALLVIRHLMRGVM